jgi:hypothetical protein
MYLYSPVPWKKKILVVVLIAAILFQGALTDMPKKLVVV